MLAVFGSIALDTIRTPKKTIQGALGGAATYAVVSASKFVDTGVVAVIGDDLSKKYHQILKEHADLSGLTIKQGEKTFQYDGKYDDTLSTRSTLKTELNVLEDFEPIVPDTYRKSQFVYLANNDPDHNKKVVKEFEKIKFSMCDTINFWINTKRESVIKTIKAADATVLDAAEARLLTKESNLLRCAKVIMKKWGATYVIIKKGEHGALLFYKDQVFPSPAFPLEHVVDPTGAGDSFAGAVMGYLASKNSISIPNIKKAVTYGNVLGSFAVQGYGLSALLDVTKNNIAKRVKEYEKMLPIPVV